jgi:hypothetical protein
MGVVEFNERSLVAGGVAPHCRVGRDGAHCCGIVSGHLSVTWNGKTEIHRLRRRSSLHTPDHPALFSWFHLALTFPLETLRRRLRNACRGCFDLLLIEFASKASSDSSSFCSLGFARLFCWLIDPLRAW